MTRKQKILMALAALGIFILGYFVGAFHGMYELMKVFFKMHFEIFEKCAAKYQEEFEKCSREKSPEECVSEYQKKVEECMIKEGILLERK